MPCMGAKLPHTSAHMTHHSYAQGMTFNNNNMQFLYKALSSNELRAHYIYYPRHTWTQQHLLNSSAVHTTRMHATRHHGWSMYNSFLCVLPGSHFKDEWTRSTFWVQILPRDSRYRRLSVWQDTNPWSRGWESRAITTRPTVLSNEYVLVYDSMHRHNAYISWQMTLSH